MDDLNEEKNTPSEEEIEELIEKLRELEKESNKRNDNNKRPRGFLTIEFGGVYHPNRIINFLFSLLINISLSYLIITVFEFATYDHLLYFISYIVVYSIFEWFIRDYVTRRYLKIIIQSFGMVYYFSYIALTYILDRYVYIGTFTFNHETTIVAFITILVIVRYFIGTSIKRYFRKQFLR